MSDVDAGVCDVILGGAGVAHGPLATVFSRGLVEAVVTSRLQYQLVTRVCPGQQVQLAVLDVVREVLHSDVA